MTKYAAVLFAAVSLLAGRGVADELPLGALTGRRGALDPAEPRVTEVIPVGACEGLDIGVGASAPIAVEVVTPEGARIASDTADALGAHLLAWDYDDAQGQHVWRVWIDHAPAGGITAGEYQIEITATESLPEPAGYALSWNGKGCSREVMGTLAVGEDHVFLGKSVAIVAMLFEGEVPLPGAAVEAAVILNGDAGRNVAGRLTLKDDGSGYDLKPGDGDYTGVFTPSIEGQYDVVATASGADSDGNPFERTFLAMFSASDGSVARLNGSYSYEKVLDEGGRVTALDILVGVDGPSTKRRFWAFASLRDAQDKHHPLQEEAVISGRSVVRFRLDAAELEEFGTTGRYRLIGVMLEEALEKGEHVLRDQAHGELLVIPAVKRMELRKEAVTLVREDFTTSTLDRNKNGRAETLIAHVWVDVPDARVYLARADLQARDRQTAASIHVRPYLPEGPQVVDFPFDGCELARSGIRGPWRLDGVYIGAFQEAGKRAVRTLADDVRGHVSMNSDDFECLCVGDCNGDGNVAVAELITGVNIVQGRDTVASCPAFDRNWDGALTVDELLSGARSAQDGCRSGELPGSSHGTRFSLWPVSGFRGQTVSFPIVLTEERKEGLAGANFEFTYPTGVLAPPVCMREETIPAEYEFSTRAVSGRVSFSYVDPALRYPAPTFSGGVLAVCEAQILTTAPVGRHPLSVTLAATANEMGFKRPNVSVTDGWVEVKQPGGTSWGCAVARSGDSRRLGPWLPLGFGLLLWLCRRRRRWLGLPVLLLLLTWAPAGAVAQEGGSIGGDWAPAESHASLQWRRLRQGKRAQVPAKARAARAAGRKQTPRRSAERRWYLKNVRVEHGEVIGQMAVCGASFVSAGTLRLRLEGRKRIGGEVRDAEGRVVATVEGGLVHRRVKGTYSAKNGDTGKWTWRLPEGLNVERLRRALAKMQRGEAAAPGDGVR